MADRSRDKNLRQAPQKEDGQILCDLPPVLFLKKNQNAPRPSERPPVRGEKNVYLLGGIGCNLIRKNIFMVFKRVPRRICPICC